MEVEMDDDGEVAGLAIVPRYEIQKELWSDDWDKATNPYWLTREQMEDVLSKLQSVGLLGEFQEKDSVSMVPTTNIRESAERYEDAVLEYRTYTPWDAKAGKPAGPERVRWARILYFRTIVGVVEATQVGRLQSFNGVPVDYRVKLGGRWYHVSECTFKKLARGKRGSFVIPSWPFFGPCR
ncbi:MAG TPA: hypothetical protein VEG08_10865 [Terriglobales bacterium]|nr:hypothetical protein [Terriglobales bacterium]